MNNKILNYKNVCLLSLIIYYYSYYFLITLIFRESVDDRFKHGMSIIVYIDLYFVKNA